jgi:hypothetical protein
MTPTSQQIFWEIHSLEMELTDPVRSKGIVTHLKAAIRKRRTQYYRALRAETKAA